MSHHYSGPDFGFPHGDARLDLTDLYAFPKPGEADKSILIMNVHPSAVVNPPGPTTREPFAPEALYELKIDTNGDAVADIAYRVRFSSSEDGSQTATLRRASGLSRRLGERWLPRGRAGERCAFHRRLRACAGARRWVCAGGSKAGRGKTAARHAVLRPDASRVFSEQWPYAHRRCRRRLPGSPHKREGDRGQGRAPHRSACRVPLFGAAAQHLCAEPCNFAYRDRASQGVQEAPGLFMKEDVMNRLEKVLYTANAHTTGGRAGMSRSSDRRLQGRLAAAGLPRTGTHPEQVLAAGSVAGVQAPV